MKDASRLPPVIVLGGAANALSVARNLGRRGIRVYTVNEAAAPVRFSRYCKYLRVPWLGDNEDSWTAYLLGQESDFLRGAVLLAACDEALEILNRDRERLAAKFLLDDCNPAAQRRMLNKLTTYQAAREAGVPLPRFWVAGAERSLGDLAPELVYPLLVKPLFSHRFGARFGGKKFFVAENRPHLEEGVAAATAAGVDVMLVELIPGGDDQLCSYYTYLDQGGAPLFDFTKRIIRRFPVGMGNGCYHVTDWNPEVRALGLQFFQHVGLRGLANAEFKRDPRDGRLKLIECNARFTAADCLVGRSGLDLASLVYNRLVGLPPPPLTNYRRGLRLWYPLQDFKAFRQLRREGQLSWGGWLRSIARPQTFPFFRWSDPLPSLGNLLLWLKADRVYVWLKRRCRFGKGEKTLQSPPLPGNEVV